MKLIKKQDLICWPEKLDCQEEEFEGWGRSTHLEHGLAVFFLSFYVQKLKSPQGVRIPQTSICSCSIPRSQRHGRHGCYLGLSNILALLNITGNSICAHSFTGKPVQTSCMGRWFSPTTASSLFLHQHLTAMQFCPCTWSLKSTFHWKE